MSANSVSASAGIASAVSKPRRKSPVRVDWKAVARLWAGGARPEAIAAQVGIDEDRLWRHLRHSPRFPRLLADEMERRRLQAEIEFGIAGRAAALDASRQADGRDMAPWQVAETGLGGAAGAADLVGRLRQAAGGRPRSKARPARPAATPTDAGAPASSVASSSAAAAATESGKPPHPQVPVRLHCIALTRPHVDRIRRNETEFDGIARIETKPAAMEPDGPSSLTGMFCNIADLPASEGLPD